MSRPSGWPEKIRVARIFIFSFCQAPWAMGQCCFRVVCALPMYNTSAHTYVGLVSRPSGWSEKTRVARIFIFSFCQAPWSMGQCCFCVVCALPMYNTSAHTYVGFVSRPSGWPEKIHVARIFIFSFCQAPWSMGQCCFCVVCALPMYNTSAHTYVGFVSRPSGWPEKIRNARFFIFSFCQATWSMGQCCFCVVCALPMYNTSAHTYVGLVSRPSGWSEKTRVARIFIFFLLSSSLVNGAMLFLCCLRIANVQYKCTHVRRICVTTQWVAGENPRRADFYFFLLPSYLVNGAMLFLCCLRIANVQYKCTHVRRTCVPTQWAVGENSRRADFCFFFCQAPFVVFFCQCLHCVRRTCVNPVWPEKIRVARIFTSSLGNGAMWFLCCLRIANVQYKCTHVRRTCVTTQWVVVENSRRADFYFFFCQAPWAMGQCCFCVVCALPMYNTSAHTYVGFVSRPSGWPEKIRVARIFIFSFCQAPWSMGQCCFCVVCALPMYNTSAHTYVGFVSRPSGWPEKIRVARIFIFFLLPSSLVNGAMLFLCCLRIANVQYKCTHVRRICVTTQWVAGENPLRADFYFFFLPSYLVNGAMLFLCCLRIANVHYKCTHVRRTCVPTQWVVRENSRRADFYFFFCQAPWAMGQCCFCVFCALPMYNTSAHTYVGLVSRPSGWPEKIRVARIFGFSFAKLLGQWGNGAMGQCCFCIVCALPMYNTSAHTYVGLVSRPSGRSEKIRVARIFVFSFAKLPGQWDNVVFVFFAHCQCTIQVHTRT